MKNQQIALDEFLKDPMRYIAQAASGTSVFSVAVPGAAHAILVSEQEWDVCMQALKLCMAAESKINHQDGTALQ